MNQEEDRNNKPSPQRGIYLLPNLLTTAALFAGFYAIVAATKGHFEAASIAIFVAILADGLDGRVARMTNTQTSFGAQYDSLSDMVAFGLAPSLVAFNWSLADLGKLGWIAAFVYTAATALRLARFNTQVSDKQYFQGLPSPSAAGMVASVVWIGADYDIDSSRLGLAVALLVMIVAALMVSSIRYWSFKSVDFRDKIHFFTAVIIVFILAAVAMEPQEMFLAMLSSYVISGPILTLWQVRKRRVQRKQTEFKSNKNNN